MVPERTSRVDDTIGTEIESLGARFARVIEAIGRVADSRNFNTVLQEVAEGARMLTNAKCGSVGAFDRSGRICFRHPPH